jgi:hypothetical protein
LKDLKEAISQRSEFEKGALNLINILNYYPKAQYRDHRHAIYLRGGRHGGIQQRNSNGHFNPTSEAGSRMHRSES